MKCIPSHTQKDPIVLNKIKEKSLKDKYLHDADEEILFDVHEHMKNHQNTVLLFISGDENFIKAISLLSDVLSFKKFRYINDFLNN